jgi:hypothetical protein
MPAYAYTYSDNQLFRIFFQKMVVLALSPFLVVLVSVTVWTAIYWVKDVKRCCCKDKRTTVKMQALTNSLRESSHINGASFRAGRPADGESGSNTSSLAKVEQPIEVEVQATIA